MRQGPMRWLFAVALATAGVAGVASGQSAPAAPTTDATTRPAEDVRRPGGPWQRPPGWLSRDYTPSPEEWESIVAFMSQNSPVRLEMFKRIEDGLGGSDRPVASQIQRTLSVRYRELKALEQRRPELFRFALTRLQFEDNVLGILRDLKQPNADENALKARLAEKVRASVDNSLDERKYRIEQLAGALERERKSLADDLTKIDELTAKQREKFEKEMSPMLNFDAQGNSPATTQAADAK